MSVLELVLATADGARRLSLYFRVHDLAIARKCFAAIEACHAARTWIFEPERTYNFPGDCRDLRWIADSLNRCIEIINVHFPDFIHRRASAEMDQETMNELHHCFETARGGMTSASEMVRVSPRMVRAAIDELNELIHRYESHRSNAEHVARWGRPLPRIVVSMYDAPKLRYELAEDDYAQFSLHHGFGAWKVNYVEVGKPLWDVFNDGDVVIGDGNIRPLRHYSADSVIYFYPSSPHYIAERSAAFDAWWDTNRAHLSKLGFEQNDPKNSIGDLPVAELDRDRGEISGASEAEIQHLLGGFPIVRDVIPHR